MAERLYVGVDVSKGTLDAAITIDGNKVLETKKVPNTKGGWDILVNWGEKRAIKKKCEETFYCLEATGIYGEGLVEYLQDKCALVSVANPAQVRAFGKTRLSRTKTDKADAGLIAMYAAVMKPAITERMAPEIKELRSLTRHLDYLVERQAEAKTRLESASNTSVIESIHESIWNDEAQIAEIERKIKAIIDKTPDIKKEIELLKSIPGISDRTARILICELRRTNQEGKITARAQVAHAGLAPAHRQSGTSLSGRAHICRTGNRRLRKCLYMPALSASRHNGVISTFYNRLLENGKNKKVALIACMRKLLMIAVGVLNNGTVFDERWANS